MTNANPLEEARKALEKIAELSRYADTTGGRYVAINTEARAALASMSPRSDGEVDEVGLEAAWCTFEDAEGHGLRRAFRAAITAYIAATRPAPPADSQTEAQS